MPLLVMTKKIGREVCKNQSQVTQGRLSILMTFAFEDMWGIYSELRSQWLPVKDRSAKTKVTISIQIAQLKYIVLSHFKILYLKILY